MELGQNRIKYLDGLRGIAIALVVLTHFWGPGWNHVLPFENEFDHIRIIRQGWVGVELFFLISGFVIFLTIERCSTRVEFFRKRFLRLFPAMVVATFITLLFNAVIQPIGQFSDDPWYNALPGLTFVSPSFWHAALDVEIDSLHHAFWTLYVEVSFYVTFGLLYFLAGWARATVVLVVLAFVTLFGRPALDLLQVPFPLRRAVEPLEWLGMQFYLWFASGIIFAKAKSLNSDRLFALACVVGLSGAVLVSPNERPLVWDDRGAMIAVLGFFALSQRSLQLQGVLKWHPLIFLGAVSYPLYLIHETVGLGLIVIAWNFMPSLPTALLPVPATIVLLGASFYIARVVEPMMRKRLGSLRLRRYGTAVEV